MIYVRIVNYEGIYEVIGFGYFVFYGWICNFLIEYYVVEFYFEFVFNEVWIEKGLFEFDGGIYIVYESIRVNQFFIVGMVIFQQYWSVCNEYCVGGQIIIGNYFRVWLSFGMNLGQQDYMIVVIEGYINLKMGQGSSGLFLINVY